MRTLPTFLMLAYLAGCGTVSHGTLQKILCTTSPSGALVKWAGGGECRTPCTVELRRKQNETLTIERDGYKTVNLPIRSVFAKSSVGNVLLPGGLVCWGIDIFSGAAWRLVPERVDVDLMPLAP